MKEGAKNVPKVRRSWMKELLNMGKRENGERSIYKGEREREREREGQRRFTVKKEGAKKVHLRGENAIACRGEAFVPVFFLLPRGTQRGEESGGA